MKNVEKFWQSLLRITEWIPKTNICMPLIVIYIGTGGIPYNPGNILDEKFSNPAIRFQVYKIGTFVEMYEQKRW
jgi:hypothetical protein